MYTILDRVDSPKDLKDLTLDELRNLCGEIRDYMIQCTSRNPGHLGSSLGSVELIVALHYIYNTPADKLVFDVGHQAYAHKILTGRREAFKKVRTRDGISGFPKRGESPYDAFGTGHSSTSISAALGFAEAARIAGTGEKAVAVIGDGALTGGLAWEGLNNAGSSKADLLVILNDNDISIDKNLGGIHNYLLNLTTDPTYNKGKSRIWDSLGESKLREWIQKRVTDTKSNLVRNSGGAVFEALGFRYFGPVDGNDLEQVIKTLRRLKDLPGPRILHCHTRKGKGFAPAEADPTIWHAPGRFDPETGVRLKSEKKADRFQDVFGEVLTDLAGKDPKVVGITPAMASGCGMSRFAEACPDRFFDVGIEEEHAVTFSAGLAAGGMKPFCNIYSSFSQRAYDQIIHDVALQNLPVILCLDRAGLVGEDGATHNGCFDLAAYRSIPNCILSAPRDELELKNLMYTALQLKTGPMFIRYPRGGGEGRAWRNEPYHFLEPGKGEKLLDGRKVAVLALGPAANRAKEAALACEQEFGLRPAVYDLRYLKPLDASILEEAGTFESILTVEDGCMKGGLFGAVSEYFAGRARKGVIKAVGIPDRFILHDSQAAQRRECSLDRDGLFEILTDMMKI